MVIEGEVSLREPETVLARDLRIKSDTSTRPLCLGGDEGAQLRE